MALVLYIIAIVIAAVAAFGVVNSKYNLLAAAIGFLGAAELVTHVAMG